MLSFLPAFVVICSIPLWTFWLLKIRFIKPVYIGWLLTAIFITGIYFFVEASPLFLMLLYITSTFLMLKLVVVYNHLAGTKQLNFSQWLLYSYMWFGMNPLPFKSFPGKPLTDYGYYFRKGISRIISGIAFIIALNFFAVYVSGAFTLLLYIGYLVSLSLILHFGLLNIAAGCLRWLGVPVSSLFKDPAKSTSLEEFWSKRWNIAFVELTTIAVLRPLKDKFGRRIAFWASYVFSGLLHEMAISLPVKKGFGMPFAYFLLQAFLILTIEQHFIKKDTPVFIKRVWVISCLVLPVFILFHKAFILQIIIPITKYFSVTL